jgi:peptidoglycan-associated lipoprotein
MLRSLAFALIVLTPLTLIGCSRTKPKPDQSLFPSRTAGLAGGLGADGFGADGMSEEARRRAGLIGVDAETGSIPEIGRGVDGQAGAPVGELPDVLFGIDSFEIDQAGQLKLDEAAAYIQSKPNLFVILRGHCDDTGTEEYNMALGSRRAQAVREYLIRKGVEQGRLETLSFGKTLPVAEGTDDASRSRNRRVEFFVYTMD